MGDSASGHAVSVSTRHCGLDEHNGNGVAMAIEDFKRWHWIAISVVIGAILTYLHIYSIDGDRLTPDETSRLSIGRSPYEVVRDLRSKLSTGVPLIYSMTIYPPVTVRGQGGMVTTQFVDGIFYQPTGSGKHAAQ